MHSPATIHRLAVLLALVMFPVRELAAQQPDSSRLLRGTAVGVALDRFTADGSDGITAVSLRVTSLRPGGFGADFAVGTYLPALQHGALLLGTDIGPAYNIAGPDVTLLIKLGGSGVVVVSSGGGGALLGAYFGGGLVARAGSKLGVRMDLVKRAYFAMGEDGSGFDVWTLSFGLTSVPRQQ